MTKMILEIDNLSVKYGKGRKEILAAEDVSIEIEEGEAVGLLGESGSGKSTIANAVLGFVPYFKGSIRFRGQDINTMNKRQSADFCRRVQPIFQDPFNSLNSSMRVYETIGEVLKVVRGMEKKDLLSKTVELLKTVELGEDVLGKFPHELSGGQCQRVGIARALAVEPTLIIADEPVSSLDVSVQAQILKLLKNLQQQFNLSFLFIAHDLAVVQQMCSVTHVMKKGRIIESGDSLELMSNPQQDYTKELIDAVPVL